MSNRNIHTLMALLIIAVFAIASPQTAQAGGTAPNTQILNSVTVDYQVGGAPQAQLTTSVDFRVDEAVTFTVTSNTGAAVTTYPLANNTQALTFIITNTGNLVHDFGLQEALLAGNSFTPTSVTFYQDNGDNLFDPATDCAETTGCSYLKQSGGEAYLDELPVDTSVRIYLAIVVSNAADAANGDTANYSLSVVARQGGTADTRGTLTSAEALANPALTKSANLTNVLIVLGDPAVDGDALHDGVITRNSAFGFLINSVNLTVTKTMTVISDPINAAVNPKAIPGAILEYTIRVEYGAGGSGTATNLVLNDDVPAGVTMQTNVYGGTGEVERITVSNGAGAVTTNLNNGDAGLTWGDPLAVQCGATLQILNDYCQIKYRIAIP